MVLTHTSKLAYESIQELGNKQLEVLGKIEELQPCSNKDIAKSLNWEINRVTGRVNELAKKGLIKSEKVARNSIGRLEKLWEVKEDDDGSSIA